jgi:hypothetical protein
LHDGCYKFHAWLCGGANDGPKWSFIDEEDRRRWNGGKDRQMSGTEIGEIRKNRVEEKEGGVFFW